MRCRRCLIFLWSRCELWLCMGHAGMCGACRCRWVGKVMDESRYKCGGGYGWGSMVMLFYSDFSFFRKIFHIGVIDAV